MPKNNSSGKGGKVSREFYELGRKYAEECLGVPGPGALAEFRRNLDRPPPLTSAERAAWRKAVDRRRKSRNRSPVAGGADEAAKEGRT